MQRHQLGKRLFGDPYSARYLKVWIMRRKFLNVFLKFRSEVPSQRHLGGRLCLASLIAFASVTPASAQQPASKCYQYQPSTFLPRPPALGSLSPIGPAHNFRVNYQIASARDTKVYTADVAVWRQRCQELGDEPVVVIGMNSFNVNQPRAPQYMPSVALVQGGKRLGAFGARDASRMIGFEEGFRWRGYDFFQFNTTYVIPDSLGMSS
jgi:hypothetical protein